MAAILWWYLAITLIGWLFFPLTQRIFRHLPGKGFAFTRAVGLLIWGFSFWLLTSLGILKNDLVSQWVVLIVLILFSLAAGFRFGYRRLGRWLRSEWRLVLSVELVFLLAFAAFAVFRATSPAITGTEKPMELAFLNAILRSDQMPPNDPWLSGFSISYYYFGYLLVAMLTRMAGTASTVAYNLSQAVWFALIAASSYGLLVDLFTLSDRDFAQKPGRTPGWARRWALLAPVLILLLGNAFGFLDALHARGVFWEEDEAGAAQSGFWAWIDLQGLSEPPEIPYQWEPHRSGSVGWWQASRVLQDRTYNGEPVEVIDEFPNFSFVLGDLHPHLLALPFCLLAIGLALNFYHAPPDEGTRVGKWVLPLRPGRYLLDAGLIGALAFLNTWDWPVYAALYAAVFLIRRVQAVGWKWLRIAEFIVCGLGMAAVGVVLYLPFFLNFSSQASGVLPSTIYFTRGVDFWAMFGPLLVPVIGFLLFAVSRKGMGRSVKLGLRLTLGILAVLAALMVLLTLVGAGLDDLGDLFMWNQGASDVSVWRLLGEAFIRRLTQPGAWLTLGVMLALGLGLLIHSMTRNGSNSKVKLGPQGFVVLLIVWGVLLVLAPEFIYLLDNFGKRMNTIFKFYYQAWLLWSLAGAYAIGVLWHRQRPKPEKIQRTILWGLVLLSVGILDVTLLAPLTGHPQTTHPELGAYLLDWLWAAWGGLVLGGLIVSGVQRRWTAVFQVLVVAALTLGLIYPAQAIPERANDFRSPETWTLDGSVYYREGKPALMAAVDWLWAAEPGVLAEAVELEGGDYSDYGRVSMLTGLPAVLGWRFHEVQWRGGDVEIGTRQEDLAVLYETVGWETAKGMIDKYNIKYIYVGDLERDTYDLQEIKFQQNLTLAFQEGLEMIYWVNGE